MKEELKNRKSLYILLSFLVAISIWIYVDEFGNDGKHLTHIILFLRSILKHYQ